MSAIRKRNVYATEFKLAYTLGLAADKLASAVPERSKYNFKSYNFEKLYGYSYSKDNLDLAREIIQSQTLLKLNKAILSIYKATIVIYNSFLPNIKTLIKKSAATRSRILETIGKVKSTLGLFQSCRLFHISTSTYNNWKDDRKCSDSIFNKCFKRYPAQLTKKEERAVRSILTDPKTALWPVISSYYYGLRNGLISMKDRTFYKYANKLGFKKNLPHSRHKKRTTGIRASKPNELIHADLTIFRTKDNIKVFIYIIMDNFSRKILSYRASLKYSAQIAFSCLKDAYENYILPYANDSDTKLMVDGGVEINNNTIDNYLCSEALSVKKIIAGQDVSFSNSMIEAVNKLLKYNYLFKTEISGFDSCVKYLDKFIPDYNDRFHCSLDGLSPNEAYYGLDYDCQEIKTRLEQAKVLRLIENKDYNCPAHKN